jgi:hypothetical protein
VRAWRRPRFCSATPASRKPTANRFSMRRHHPVQRARSASAVTNSDSTVTACMNAYASCVRARLG